MREFDTGATRDTDEGKHDFEGFLSPLVLERYAQYMTKHRKQADGELRDSDNWQKGIPQDQYMKSAWRHWFEMWKSWRGWGGEDIEEAACALLFNIMGWMHEHLKVKIVGVAQPKAPHPISREDANTSIIQGNGGLNMYAEPDKLVWKNEEPPTVGGLRVEVTDFTSKG